MEYEYEVLGKTVRSLRQEKGLSQEVLSGLAGIARTHLSMIENGTIHANLDTMWKISLALGIRLSDLIAIAEKRMDEQEP